MDNEPRQGHHRFELRDPLEDMYNSAADRDYARALMERADGFADLLVLIARALRHGVAALAGVLTESAKRRRHDFGGTSADRVART